MIRIAYITSTLDVGGAECQLLALATRLDRDRFSPAVYCLSGEGAMSERLRRAGVPVTTLGLRGLCFSRTPMRMARGLISLLSAVRRQSPQIVHGWLYHGYIAAAAAGTLSRGAVVVAGRRSLSSFKARRPWLRRIDGPVNRMTDIVIANSEAVRRDTIQAEKLPDWKVVVIYNGLEPAAYGLPPDESLRRELGIAGAGPVATCVANLIHYKGHRFLLEAWKDVHRAFPSAVLLLAGDGPLRRDLQEFASLNGLAHSVRFLGLRDDVAAILALTDLLVHPSCEEGFSNAILEGMAAGRPVIATAVGGNIEAVLDGRTGVLVPPQDAAALAREILALFADPARRERLGAAGRDRIASAFTVDRMVESYASIYEQLCARARPPAFTSGPRIPDGVNEA